jgi:hypothetical protein
MNSKIFDLYVAASSAYLAQDSPQPNWLTELANESRSVEHVAAGSENLMQPPAARPRPLSTNP